VHSGKTKRGSFILVADDDVCPSPEPTVLAFAEGQMFDVSPVRWNARCSCCPTLLCVLRLLSCARLAGFGHYAHSRTPRGSCIVCVPAQS